MLPKASSTEPSLTCSWERPFFSLSIFFLIPSRSRLGAAACASDGSANHTAKINVNILRLKHATSSQTSAEKTDFLQRPTDNRPRPTEPFVADLKIAAGRGETENRPWTASAEPTAGRLPKAPPAIASRPPDLGSLLRAQRAPGSALPTRRRAA